MLKYLMIAGLLALSPLIPSADNTDPCYGLLPETCRALFPPSSNTAWAQGQPCDPMPLLQANRPANIHASTTDGLTTISWAAPLYHDHEDYCPVDQYSVYVIDLTANEFAVHEYGIKTTVLVTDELEANKQYMIEIVGSSHEPGCLEPTQRGMYTYQF